MLRIDVARAKPGMKLALPVPNPKMPSRTLLKLGYELTPEILRRLQEQGIRSVWVCYPSLECLGRFVDLQVQQQQQELVSQVSSTFESLQSQAAAKLGYEDYLKTLEQLVDQLASHPQSMVFLGDLADTDDDLIRHSASVTYLTLLLGLKLESYLVKERKHVSPERAKEVANLGLGAMLHDVGITQIDPEARIRFEETADESDGQWQEHTCLGFRMVRGRVDPSAATVVLNHHQRFDGSGFAGPNFPVLAEKNIHIFARIAAVADQFDRMRNPPHLPAQSTAWVLSCMVSEPLRSKFDPQVLRALLTVVPPFPPGSIVRLSDGQHAVCVDHQPDDPCRPTVQTIPDPEQLDTDDLPVGRTIDLAAHPATLQIVEHEGHDVREFNFEPPSDLRTDLKRQMAYL